MAIHFASSDPKALLAAFNARINQTEPKGKITTWAIVQDGKFYTHKAQDWKNKAFFKPVIKEGWLTFNIIRPQNEEIATLVYAYYHGHLLETFINHFNNSFAHGSASALPEKDDNVAAPKA